MTEEQLLAALADHPGQSSFWLKVADLATTRIKQAEAADRKAEITAKLATGDYFVRWQSLHRSDCHVALEGIEISISTLSNAGGGGGEVPWVELIHKADVPNYAGRRCTICAPGTQPS